MGFALLWIGAAQGTDVAQACTKHWIAVQESGRSARGRAQELGVSEREYAGYLKEQEVLALDALKKTLAAKHSETGIAMFALMQAYDPITRGLERARDGASSEEGSRARRGAHSTERRPGSGGRWRGWHARGARRSTDASGDARASEAQDGAKTPGWTPDPGVDLTGRQRMWERSLETALVRWRKGIEDPTDWSRAPGWSILGTLAWEAGPGMITWPLLPQGHQSALDAPLAGGDWPSGGRPEAEVPALVLEAHAKGPWLVRVRGPYKPLRANGREGWPTKAAREDALTQFAARVHAGTEPTAPWEHGIVSFNIERHIAHVITSATPSKRRLRGGSAQRRVRGGIAQRFHRALANLLGAAGTPARRAALECALAALKGYTPSTSRSPGHYWRAERRGRAHAGSSRATRSRWAWGRRERKRGRDERQRAGARA